MKVVLFLLSVCIFIRGDDEFEDDDEFDDDDDDELPVFTFEPTFSTLEPTEATLEPTLATLEPTQATLEPTLATQEPTPTTEEPTPTTQEPTPTTQEPTPTTQEPTPATLEPTGATLEPTGATPEPTEATQLTPEPTLASQEPTTQHPSNTQTSQPTTLSPTAQSEERRSFSFALDFGSVVGTQESLFLEECNEFWEAVTCVSVVEGSVIITLQGFTSSLSDAEAILHDPGMDLPSFPLLQLTPSVGHTPDVRDASASTSASESSILSQLWVVILIFVGGMAVASFIGCCCRKRDTSNEKGFRPAEDEENPDVAFGQGVLELQVVKKKVNLAMGDSGIFHSFGDGLGNTPQFPNTQKKRCPPVEGANPTGFSVVNHSSSQLDRQNSRPSVVVLDGRRRGEPSLDLGRRPGATPQTTAVFTPTPNPIEILPRTASSPIESCF